MLPNYDTRDRGDPYTSSKSSAYKGATDLSRFKTLQWYNTILHLLSLPLIPLQLSLLLLPTHTQKQLLILMLILILLILDFPTI